MAYIRKEISAAEIAEQKAVCERVRVRLNDGKQRYALVDTYGCQQNESDSEILRGWLRDNMGYYTDLYNSKISALSALASDYQRQTHDSLEKLGSEQNQRQHGESISYTPTNKGTKNYIIPLGGSAEVELNQTQETGSDTTAHSGTDTDTLSFTNRVDTRWITENITGATGKDKAELIKMYRDLIVDLDTMIIKQMYADGLFMKVW